MSVPGCMHDLISCRHHHRFLPALSSHLQPHAMLPLMLLGFGGAYKGLKSAATAALWPARHLCFMEASKGLGGSAEC